MCLKHVGASEARCLTSNRDYSSKTARPLLQLRSALHVFLWYSLNTAFFVTTSITVNFRNRYDTWARVFWLGMAAPALQWLKCRFLLQKRIERIMLTVLKTYVEESSTKFSFPFDQTKNADIKSFLRM